MNTNHYDIIYYLQKKNAGQHFEGFMLYLKMIYILGW